MLATFFCWFMFLVICLRLNSDLHASVGLPPSVWVSAVSLSNRGYKLTDKLEWLDLWAISDNQHSEVLFLWSVPGNQSDFIDLYDWIGSSVSWLPGLVPSIEHFCQEGQNKWDCGVRSGYKWRIWWWVKSI